MSRSNSLLVIIPWPMPNLIRMYGYKVRSNLLTIIHYLFLKIFAGGVLYPSTPIRGYGYKTPTMIIEALFIPSIMPLTCGFDATLNRMRPSSYRENETRICERTFRTHRAIRTIGATHAHGSEPDMQLVTARDIFDLCLKFDTSTEGFTQTTLENALGLNRSALQKLLGTPAFVKHPKVGYMLAVKDYDTWANLAGIKFSVTARVALTRPHRFDEREISTLAENMRKVDLNQYRDYLLDGSESLTDDWLREIANTAEALWYLVEYARKDPRRTLNYPSIWETRPL